MPDRVFSDSLFLPGQADNFIEALKERLQGIDALAGQSYGSAKVAAISRGAPILLPSLIHSGPDRAGGGEELGSVRGLSFFYAAHSDAGLKRPDRQILSGLQGGIEWGHSGVFLKCPSRYWQAHPERENSGMALFNPC